MSECDWPHCRHEPEVDRDRWGRPTGPWNTDDSLATVSRISTVAKAAGKGDATGLMNWAAGRAIAGVLADRGLADAAAVAVGAKDDAALRDVAVRAQETGGRATAADRGTALHAAITAALRGDPLATMPDSMAMSVEAALMLLDRAGLTVVHADEFGVLFRGDAPVAAGSYDLVVKEGGSFVVADIKTSAKENDRKYPHAVAAQVAGYARMRRWCPRHGWLRNPPIDLSRGLLLSVPLDASSASLDELDLELGWSGFQHGLDTRAYQAATVIRPYAGLGSKEYESATR